MNKVYVKVLAEHDIEGNITPIMLTWPNQRKFKIDRVLDVRQAASLKAGGVGIRYICRILDKQVKLFYDKGYWFVEIE